MASYISSYFGSGGSNAQSQQHQSQYQPQYQQYQQSRPLPQTSSSTWGNTFSSRIGALRKALTKDNEEDDPDNEDCSHVSNVLRAYYMEKGRPFPEWLPPDPKKPAVAPVQQPQFGQYGNMYPGQYGNNVNGMPHSRGNSTSGASGRGGLSDLWDSGPAQPVQAQSQSLRAPRLTPQALRSSDSLNRQSGSDTLAPQARPLPSQRAGSYQNIQPAPTPPTAGNSRDRLRARLQGGGGGRSSSPANASQGSYKGLGSYDRQPSGNGPNMSASQPWSNDGDQYGYDAPSGGYVNPAHQQRPSGYR